MILLPGLLVFFVACTFILGYKLYIVSQERITVATINAETEQQAQQLEEEIASKKNELQGLQESVKAQNNIIKSLKDLAEQTRAQATKDAEQAHDVRMRELDIEYKEKLEKANSWLEEQIKALTLTQRQLQTKIQMEEDSLKDLKAKQDAYIAAKQRELEMEEKKDFYRMVLTEEEIADVQALRKIQPGFSRKDSIDKLIWEGFYKPAYDLLMGRLNLTPSKKICGIYKISNLDNGLTYIGQSVDIRERWRTHIKTSLEHGSTTNKLYQAMKRYGAERFSFEILEEVPRAQLNEREVYWIDFYKTKEVGLNSTKGGS